MPYIGSGNLCVRNEIRFIWQKIETYMGSSLPCRLKNILTFNGFCCARTLSALSAQNITAVEEYSRRIPSTVEKIVKSATKNSKKAKRIVREILETYYGCYSENNEIDDNFQLSPGDKELLAFISQIISRNTKTIDDNRDFSPFQGICEENTPNEHSKCPVVKTAVGYLFSDFQSNAEDDRITEKRRRTHTSGNISLAHHENDLESTNTVDVSEESFTEHLRMIFTKSYANYVTRDESTQNGNNLEELGILSIDSKSVSSMLKTLKESQKNSEQDKPKLSVKGTIKCRSCTKIEKQISVTWISNPLSMVNIGQIVTNKQTEGSIGYWNLSNLKRHHLSMHKNDNTLFQSNTCESENNTSKFDMGEDDLNNQEDIIPKTLTPPSTSTIRTSEAQDVNVVGAHQPAQTASTDENFEIVPFNEEPIPQKFKIIFFWISGRKFDRTMLKNSKIDSVIASQNLLKFSEENNPKQLLRILEQSQNVLKYCFDDEILSIISKLNDKRTRSSIKYQHKCAKCDKEFGSKAWECKRCLFWFHLQCESKNSISANNKIYHFCESCYNSE